MAEITFSEIAVKNVYFKNDEAKALWEKMLQEQPAEMCDLLIGGHISMLQNLYNDMEQYFKLGEACNSLDAETIKKAQTVQNAIETYRPQMEKGELKLTPENKNLVDTYIGVSVSNSALNKLAAIGQELIKAIEEISAVKEKVLQAERDKGIKKEAPVRE